MDDSGEFLQVRIGLCSRCASSGLDRDGAAWRENTPEAENVVALHGERL